MRHRQAMVPDFPIDSSNTFGPMKGLTNSLGFFPRTLATLEFGTPKEFMARIEDSKIRNSGRAQPELGSGRITGGKSPTFCGRIRKKQRKNGDAVQNLHPPFIAWA